jgi:penicillin amidase
MSGEVGMVLDAFSQGINSWMEETTGNLPVEFDLLDYEPQPWTPADTIAVWKWRWWMLTGRLESISVSEAVRRHLPPDLLDVFLSVEAGDETIVPCDEPAGIGGYDTGEGSNNWVVGSSRSTTGRPILASDPHNPVWQPSQWYQAQLTAPGTDAIGAIFVGTPGIYLGHTRRTAWGVTNHTASNRDLYVETVSGDDPDLYREGGDWQRFEVEEQEIPVRGQPAERLSLRRTVRGPVVNDLLPHLGDGPEPPISMRWTGAGPETGFEAMLALHRSRSVDDVLNALAQWPNPILNFVFSDSDGRIGYHAVGRVPVRKVDWQGYRPAGDPDHAWDGFYAFDELPQLVDPDRDWVATANNPPWGGRGPYLDLGSWSDGYRFRRIRERIESSDRHAPEEVGAIHADVLHARAQELAPPLAEIALGGRRKSMREIGELLAAWDGSFGTDEIGPTVFTAFWEKWLRRVARARFPDSVANRVSGRCGGVARRLLLGDNPGWFPDRADLRKEVREALQEALDWLKEAVGARRSQWRWGRLHTVLFAHPISENETLSSLFDLGPHETTGAFMVTGLSSYRMVVDMNDTAKSWAVTTSGQSGHPASPHYRDNAQVWLDDGYHPLWMDDEDIDRNLEADLRLEP